MQILVLQQPRPVPPLPVLPARPQPRPPVPPLRPQPPRQFLPNTVHDNYGYEDYY